MGVSDAGDKIEGLDSATGIRYNYQGPIVMDNYFMTKFHTEEAPMVVTLCGSTRFKDQFLSAMLDFTLLGWIVLTVGGFPWADMGGAKETVLGEEVAKRVDLLHKQKIDMSMCIYVVGNGYVGDSTMSEITHAHHRGIRVFFEQDATPGEVVTEMEGMHK